jgi:hypothetical protein
MFCLATKNHWPHWHCAVNRIPTRDSKNFLKALKSPAASSRSSFIKLERDPILQVVPTAPLTNSFPEKNPKLERSTSSTCLGSPWKMIYREISVFGR